MLLDGKDVYDGFFIYNDESRRTDASYIYFANLGQEYDTAPAPKLRVRYRPKPVKRFRVFGMFTYDTL